MLPEIITLKEVRDIIASGEHFSCVAVSFDKKRRTGGEFIEIIEGVIAKKDSDEFAERSLTKIEREIFEIKTKSPNHYLNHTRNVAICVDGYVTNVIKKIHPPLIIKFNGKNVVP